MRTLLLLMLLMLLMLLAPSAEAMRLVVLSPHSVEMVYELGAGDEILATVDYADYPEAARAIPRIGRHDHLNLERLLELQPELVVLSFDDTSDAILARLNALGVPLFDTGVTSVDQVADRLQALGAAIGRPAQGQSSARQFRERLARLRQQYRHRTRVKVFYQVWPEPLTTVSGGWMNGILADCGADNIFADGVAAYPQVAMEQVLMRMPELIIKPFAHGGRNQQAVAWDSWPEIPAVKHGHLAQIDGDLLHRTGPRVLEGMARVCQLVEQVRQEPVR
ncbi:cobalamin-binding protein [Ferrimonas sediminicola]|uniref:Cobalamin-binding protein n=1 Tax=Ferrimonas sediminicola TaxID=2569538 RepID=A0A4U1BGD9_9GAMM|nr:cobalamin-binding protein [Ferrimonas sediminicola]TKB50275.1 cobalamin-binding protein [Ferrimonas sediminicola]